MENQRTGSKFWENQSKFAPTGKKSIKQQYLGSKKNLDKKRRKNLKQKLSSSSGAFPLPNLIMTQDVVNGGEMSFPRH